MCLLNKNTFALLLCLVVCAKAFQDSELAEDEERATERSRQFRHSRYQKLDQLLNKIDKHGEIKPTEDKEIGTLIKNYLPTVLNEAKYESEPVTKSIPKEVEVYDDYMYEDLDDSEDSDYDAETIGDDKEEQTKVVHNIEEDNVPNKLSEMIKNYMADQWSADIESDFEDPSQDYDDQEWEDGSQSDSEIDTTTRKINWQIHSTGIKIVHHRSTKQADMQMVSNHVGKMSREGSCKIPIRKVIPVQSVHPDPSKMYIPHCTFLYRCGDDAGCCKSDTRTCVPKETNRVHLYFYTRTVGRRSDTIEKLSFINHTECECVAKRDFMVKDETIFSLRPGPSYKNALNFPEPATEAPPALRRCQCPSEFSATFNDEGECTCDCHNRQRDCLRIKKGREYFGLKDRQCILNGPCIMPNCEFGTYIRSRGRCPRKHEQNDYKLNRKY